MDAKVFACVEASFWFVQGFVITGGRNQLKVGKYTLFIKYFLQVKLQRLKFHLIRGTWKGTALRFVPVRKNNWNVCCVYNTDVCRYSICNRFSVGPLPLVQHNVQFTPHCPSHSKKMDVLTSKFSRLIRRFINWNWSDNLLWVLLYIQMASNTFALNFILNYIPIFSGQIALPGITLNVKRE